MVDVSSYTRSHWFTHLSCGQSYDIRMRTNNRERSSEYSEVISAHTLGGSKLIICIYVYVVNSHTITICHMIIKFRIVENDAVHAVV